MFDFLEVNSNDHKENLVYIETIKEIPQDQYLKYSDLITIIPDSNVLKIISKRILDKYTIVPLYVQLPSTKPFLPKHLKSEFWGNIQGKKDITMFVALPNPFDNQILNILKSISDYNIVSIPLDLESGKKFLKNDFSNIKNNTKPTVEKKENEFKKFVKENTLYILVFLFIAILFILVKTLIIE